MENKTIWAKDEENFVVQTVETSKSSKPTGYIFVVDTAKCFQAEKDNVIAAIKSLPPESEVGLVLSGGNGLNTEIAYPHSFTGSPDEIAAKVSDAEFAGGTDNMPALMKAAHIADEKKGSVVVAFYAPQPFNFSSTLENQQFFTRRNNNQMIYRFVSSNEYDAIAAALKDYEIFFIQPRFSNFAADFATLYKQLDQENSSFKYVRRNVEKAELQDSWETSQHLIRLWANDEVSRILEQEHNEPKAVELAQKYRLVTPVTGAVVLETQEQYDRFGLKPVDKATVPTIPEPETYLLIAVILGVLVWLIANRKLF